MDSASQAAREQELDKLAKTLCLARAAGAESPELLKSILSVIAESSSDREFTKLLKSCEIALRSIGRPELLEELLSKLEEIHKTGWTEND